MRVYRVAGVARRRSLAPPRRSNKPSIAVLPFTSMSGDIEQQYFGDGITEDIITELARFRNLHVLARNTSFRYRGQDVDVQRVSAASSACSIWSKAAFAAWASASASPRS